MKRASEHATRTTRDPALTGRNDRKARRVGQQAKNRVRAGVTASFTLAAISTVLFLMPAPATPDAAPSHIDKVVHFVLFFLMVLPGLSVVPRSWVWVVPLAICFGALIEFIQPMFGRGFSWADMVANALGAMSAVPLAWWVNTRWLERRKLQ